MNHQNDKLGIALVVSGPSGTGKSTICSVITERNQNLNFSVSCTTRKPRPLEKEGEDYYFLSREEFESKIEQNMFIEYAEVHGNFYGTLCSEIIDRVEKGQDVLLDIDVQGAMQIKEFSKKNSTLAAATEYIFIAPPDLTILEKRLRARGTEEDSVIQIRLNNAIEELAKWQKYDYLIINDHLNDAVSEFQILYEVLHLKTNKVKNISFGNFTEGENEK
jgi:guanylate kinase